MTYLGSKIRQAIASSGLLQETTIKHLYEQYRENLETQKNLAQAQQNLTNIFDAVSDCVFVFTNERIEFTNNEARYVIEHASDSIESIEERLLAAVKEVGSNPSARLDITALSGSNLVLLIRSHAEIVLSSGPSLIVTAENISTTIQLKQDVLTAAQQEQQRIGRDLHDGLGQLLTGLAFQAQGLSKQIDSSVIKQRAENIAHLASLCARSGNLLSRGFNLNIGDAAALDGALNLLCEYLNSTGEIACLYELEVTPQAENAQAFDHLYHIAREAVRHAKHQRGATRLKIDLRESCLIFEYDIDKTGDAQTGIDLKDIQKRTSLIPAELRIVTGQISESMHIAW